MNPAERLFLRSLAWLAGGVAAALPLLLLPPADVESLLARSTIHLSALVLLGLAGTAHVAPLAADRWFAGGSGGRTLKVFGAGAAAVAVVTFMVSLVTLATSAALRLEPSMQFLQLLSAMDIAWVVAATFVGAYLWRGVAVAWPAAIGIAGLCVWSIWRYLDTVGFTEEGGWLVSGPDLWRLVIPFDMAAAAVAVAVLILGSRHQATAQRRLQS